MIVSLDAIIVLLSIDTISLQSIQKNVLYILKMVNIVMHQYAMLKKYNY